MPLVGICIRKHKTSSYQESYFPLHHVDGWLHVCHIPDDEIAPGSTVERSQAGGGSVVLWTMFCRETLSSGPHVGVALTSTPAYTLLQTK